MFPIPGYEVDLNTFSSWFSTAARYGPRVFYNMVWCDYPPLNIYLFWGLGSIANTFSFFGTPQIYNLIKLFSSLFDIATSAVIFIFLRKRLDFKKALLATSLYAFNPAVIINSAIWGQLDAIYTSIILLSIIFILISKPKLSVIFLVLSLLTKPQSIAIAPLILFLIFTKYKWKTIASSLLAGVATLFIVIIPFEWSNPITFLTNIYFGAYEGYAYTTVNAFNLWALGGLWVQDTLFLFIIGWTLFGTLIAFALFVLQKRLNYSRDLLVIFIAFTLFLGFFMLPTRIHERYLFPAISILTLAIPFVKKVRPIYIISSVTLFINQAYVLYYLNLGTFISQGDPIVLIVSSINVILLMYVLSILWDELKGCGFFKKERTKSMQDKKLR
jgi:Gpi18-like mannosyltransferase